MGDISGWCEGSRSYRGQLQGSAVVEAPQMGTLDPDLRLSLNQKVCEKFMPPEPFQDVEDILCLFLLIR